MRNGHLEETLRRIIAGAISTKVQDPRIGFVTISEVRLNKDNTVAQVFYTVLGEKEEKRDTLKGLKRCRGFLRQQIGDQIRLRMLPELRFQYDDSLDRSFDLEDTFNAIRDSQQVVEEGGSEEE